MSFMFRIIENLSNSNYALVTKVSQRIELKKIKHGLHSLNSQTIISETFLQWTLVH